MVWCNHCGRNVPGIRPYACALACNLCGRILENFNFSSEVTFVKNAAGQSQASGNIVKSVQSGVSSSRARRIRIARDEFMNMRDGLGIGDERDDVIDMAARFFTMAVENNFTKGRRTELVLSSCLYLTCREKNIPCLLIDFSSYLRVSIYELGSVYLQLCEMLYIAENRNYEKLVDPSIFIPRFSNSLLKGTHDKAVIKTTRDIIASMKRDWIHTGRKPSGICGAALYTAALSHGIKCSKTDIVKIVHICEATLTKRLIEFKNAEAASLNVDELSERQRVLHKRSFTTKPNSDRERVFCMHQDCKPFLYGLCESCYHDFINVSGGLVGGSDPPAFQQAEKERMEKPAREERCSEKDEVIKDGDDGHYEVSDESDNLDDMDDAEVDSIILNEEEKALMKTIWEELNGDWLVKQEKKKKANEALNVSNVNCTEYARSLVEASKEAVTKSRKEKRQKRAEEAKNSPLPATAMEAVCRTLEKKGLSTSINYDVLDELLNTSPVEKSPKRLKTDTDMEEKKKEVKSNEHENGENEDNNNMKR